MEPLPFLTFAFLTSAVDGQVYQVPFTKNLLLRLRAKWLNVLEVLKQPSTIAKWLTSCPLSCEADIKNAINNIQEKKQKLSNVEVEHATCGIPEWWSWFNRSPNNRQLCITTMLEAHQLSGGKRQFYQIMTEALNQAPVRAVFDWNKSEALDIAKKIVLASQC